MNESRSAMSDSLDLLDTLLWLPPVIIETTAATRKRKHDDHVDGASSSSKRCALDSEALEKLRTDIVSLFEEHRDHFAEMERLKKERDELRAFLAETNELIDENMRILDDAAAASQRVADERAQLDIEKSVLDSMKAQLRDVFGLV